MSLRSYGLLRYRHFATHCPRRPHPRPLPQAGEAARCGLGMLIGRHVQRDFFRSTAVQFDLTVAIYTTNFESGIDAPFDDMTEQAKQNFN